MDDAAISCSLSRSSTSSFNNAADDCRMHNLPMEVLNNIFLRLPMGTLATVLRYVCRSWRSIIERPSFSHAHPWSSPGIILQIPAREGKILGETLKIGDIKPRCHRRYGSLSEMDDYDKAIEETKSEEEEDSYLRRSHCAFIPAKDRQLHILCDDFFWAWHLKVEHSCDGLLLLSRNGLPAIICNPLLRRWAPLPEDHDGIEDHAYYKGMHMFMGLGFDPVEDVYKVFSLVRVLRYAGMQKFSPRVCVLSGNNADKWKWKCPNGSLPQKDIRLDGPKTPALVNGRLHWVLVGFRSLLTVDVHTEDFRTLPLPAFRREGYYDFKVDFGVVGVGDPLRVVTISDEVWVMKEYGQPESWEKEAPLQKSGYYTNWQELWLRWANISNPPEENQTQAVVIPYIPMLGWPEDNSTGDGTRRPEAAAGIDRVHGSTVIKDKKAYEFNRMWPPIRCSCNGFLALLTREKKYPFREYYICEEPRCFNFMWVDKNREQTGIAGDIRRRVQILTDENTSLKYENIMLRKEIHYLRSKKLCTACLVRRLRPSVVRCTGE